MDFAGGNVVHISSGVSGLVLAILLGRRRGVEHVSYRVHNIPFVFLGAGLLWFGWFGFNAGSALGANGLAAHAFLTSALASGTALLVWMLLDVVKDGKPTLVGASTGLVVGLVAITPGAGFVPVWSAIIIGGLVSPICYFTMNFLKKKLKSTTPWTLSAATASAASGAVSPRGSLPRAVSTPWPSGTAWYMGKPACSWPSC